MFWKKSRADQKFLTNSHYNENYPDHKKSYKHINHVKEPYLATLYPNPTQILRIQGDTAYMNEF